MHVNESRGLGSYMKSGYADDDRMLKRWQKRQMRKDQLRNIHPGLEGTVDDRDDIHLTASGISGEIESTSSSTSPNPKNDSLTVGDFLELFVDEDLIRRARFLKKKSPSANGSTGGRRPSWLSRVSLSRHGSSSDEDHDNAQSIHSNNIHELIQIQSNRNSEGVSSPTTTPRSTQKIGSPSPSSPLMTEEDRVPQFTQIV